MTRPNVESETTAHPSAFHVFILGLKLVILPRSTFIL